MKQAAWLLVRLLWLGTVYTFLGVTNNLAFWAVGNAMPRFPTFLAYASCFFNPLVFLCAWHFQHPKRKALSNKLLQPNEDETTEPDDASESGKLCPSRNIHAFGIVYGLFMAGNSVFGMFSDSHISGLLQNILNQSMLPIMALLSRVCLHQKMDRWEALGSIVVMIGSVFGVVTSLNDDGPQEPVGQQVFWVLVYVTCIASLPPQSIIQQYVVAKYGVNPIPLIFVGSFYAVLFSLLSVFLDALPPFVGAGSSLSQVADTQQAAWQCVFGAQSTDCANGAWQLYLLYALSGALMAWNQMVLVAEESAMFFVIIDAISVPITAISFCVPAFMGSGAETLTWQSLVSVVIIMVGIVVFKLKDIAAAVSCSTTRTT
jgi:hypothetical protein